jgi:hypothetical protein
VVVAGAPADQPPADTSSASSLGDTTRSSPVRSLGGTALQYQAENGTSGNTTDGNDSDVLHRNPEEVESENRLDRLVSYLSGDLNGRIGESSLRLSQGEYDAARSVLGDDYSDSLGKYVDVDGETDGDGASEEYRTVQETQREYADTVGEFRETQREYEEARQAGDRERARELARELNRLAEEGGSQSDRLIDAYGGIANATGDDLSESRDRITAVQSEITDQSEEIVARELVETRLVVRSYDRDISFSDPLVVSGALETANGTPVETETARFAVGGRTVRTAVDDDGTFELAYRPTVIDANTSELGVEYRPLDSSVYRTSNETLAVDVTQVTATVRTGGPAAVSYGYADRVAVEASVRADDTPVTDYPLSLSLEGASLTTTPTNASGRATLTGAVPASVPTGDAELRIASDRDDRAVRVEPATESLPIESEATDLSAGASANAEGTVVVEGRLLTAEGEAVEDQPVSVELGGQSLKTTTGASGTYRAAIDPPVDADVENATVSAAFDGSGTNLESAEAIAAVTPADAVGQEIDGEDGDQSGVASGESFPLNRSELLWVIAGVAVVGIVTVLLLRRNGAAAGDDDTAADAASPSEAGGDPEPAAASEPDVSESALQSAATALSSGRPNDAVVTAYGGVREALAARMDVDPSATHWEFHRQCVDRGIDGAESLESLTTGYEKAAYSGLAVSDDDAEALLERARSLLDTAEAR